MFEDKVLLITGGTGSFGMPAKVFKYKNKGDTNIQSR